MLKDFDTSCPARMTVSGSAAVLIPHAASAQVTTKLNSSAARNSDSTHSCICNQRLLQPPSPMSFERDCDSIMCWSGFQNWDFLSQGCNSKEQSKFNGQYRIVTDTVHSNLSPKCLIEMLACLKSEAFKLTCNNAQSQHQSLLLMQCLCTHIAHG